MSTASDPDDILQDELTDRRQHRVINLHEGVTGLVVLVGGERHDVVPSSLAEDAYVGRLRNEWRDDDPLIFIISFLLSWSDVERWLVLVFIAGFTRRYTVRVRETGPDLDDLFLAVLEMLVSHDNVLDCARAVRATVEAAALRHAGELAPACSRIIARLQELGVRGYRAASLEEDARQLVATQRTQELAGQDEAHLVFEALPDSPVPPNLIVPRDWTLSAAGVRRGQGDQGRDVIWTPIVITRRATDVANGAECLGIAWYRDEAWQERVVERTTVATSRSVVELADFGLPVTSNNAADLVQYLADFEAANADDIPRSQVTSQLGWQGERGCAGFLWGRQLLSGAGGHSADGTVGQPLLSQNQLVFRGHDDGDEQLVAGFHARGTFEGWCDAVRPLGRFPRARLVVYVALCAPMLEVLGTSNFIFSYDGG